MSDISATTASCGSTLSIDEIEEALAEGACFGRTDFSGNDLRGARVPGIDLRGCRLTNVRFDGAVLAGACFRSADMRGISLVRADLRRAGLREANLAGANLRTADLREANLLDADLTGAELGGAHIDGAAFNAASLRTARLHGALFDGQPLVGTHPILQVSCVGRIAAMLTVYRIEGRCLTSLDGSVLEDVELEEALRNVPHCCERDEMEALLALSAAHRKRST